MEIDPWLPRAAAQRPDGAGLVTPEGSVSYAELLLGATRAAGALAARAVKPGTRVAIALPPGRAFVETLHACGLLGAAAIPVDPRLGERERSEQTRTAAVVVDAPLSGDTGLFVAQEAWDPDAVALVVHTSGTTGAAQPIELSFGNVAAHVRAATDATELRSSDRWLCPLPLSHVGGLMAALRCAARSATLVLEPPPFDAGRVARALGEDVNVASLVPTMLQRVLDAGVTAGPSLRLIVLGGGTVTRALLLRARASGLPVAQSYGLTQACSTVTLSEPGDLDTAGRPLHGFGLSIAEDGEIFLTGDAVAGRHVVHTGDLGRLDEAGRLVVVGRKADTIITGGENVAPAEVEAVLESHPGVAEAGVFAREHPLWGEAVSAKVVAIEGEAPSAAELRAHCATRLAGYKVPKSFELVGALPRTGSGKLLRREL